MQLSLETVDVFTSRRFAGNQLAVFPAAAGLSTEQMQAIAREIGYSETTFVVGKSAGALRVRIFTPHVELPFAGHPSLGTAAVALGFATGKVVLELGVGPVPVEVVRTAFGARCELVAPPAQRLAMDAAIVADVLPALGLRAEDVEPALPVETWSVGNPFLIVPLRELVALERAHVAVGPRRPGWPLGVLAFAPVGSDGVRARVFVPGDTVPEDPATGSANAPLAAYLHAHEELALGATLSTAQGVEMGRPSELSCRLERDPDGALRARVGGGVVPVIRGTMTL